MPTHVTINGREVRDPRARALLTAAVIVVVAVILMILGAALAIALAVATGGALVYAGARAFGLLGGERGRERDRDPLLPEHRPQLPSNDSSSQS